MTIHLVANDAELYKVCSDILAEMPDMGRGWALRLVSPEEGPCDAEVHIWNFHPNLRLPENFQNSLRHIFLVEPKDLAEFRRRTGLADADAIVKPAPRALLAAYLTAAVSTSVARSLRDER